MRATVAHKLVRGFSANSDALKVLYGGEIDQLMAAVSSLCGGRKGKREPIQSLNQRWPGPANREADRSAISHNVYYVRQLMAWLARILPAVGLPNCCQFYPSPCQPLISLRFVLLR